MRSWYVKKVLESEIMHLDWLRWMQASSETSLDCMWGVFKSANSKSVPDTNFLNHPSFPWQPLNNMKSLPIKLLIISLASSQRPASIFYTLMQYEDWWKEKFLESQGIKYVKGHFTYDSKKLDFRICVHVSLTMLK